MLLPLTWPLLASMSALAAAALGLAVAMPDPPPPPPGGRLVPGAPPPVGAWAKRVVGVVVGAESGGNYGAQNKNSDGAGLSYGLIQWTQKHGNLGLLLRRFHKVDAAGFSRIFGPDGQALLATTTASSKTARLAPVGGVSLWREPWTARFTAAGKHPPFQAAQWAELFEGAHWQGGLQAARILGIYTERSYALFFDRSVHQGPAAAKQIAEATKAKLTANGSARVSHAAVLRLYAQFASARFQRVEFPGEGWKWNSETDRWHRYAGPYDLFSITAKRTAHILSTAALSDAPLS